METTKVRLLLNLGWMDAEAVGLDHLSAEDMLEGTVLEVDEKQADSLVNRLKCAEICDPATERAKAKMKAAPANAKTGAASPEDSTK